MAQDPKPCQRAPGHSGGLRTSIVITPQSPVPGFIIPPPHPIPSHSLQPRGAVTQCQARLLLCWRVTGSLGDQRIREEDSSFAVWCAVSSTAPAQVSPSEAQPGCRPARTQGTSRGTGKRSRRVGGRCGKGQGNPQNVLQTAAPLPCPARRLPGAHHPRYLWGWRRARPPQTCPWCPGCAELRGQGRAAEEAGCRFLSRSSRAPQGLIVFPQPRSGRQERGAEGRGGHGKAPRQLEGRGVEIKESKDDLGRKSPLRSSSTNVNCRAHH